MMNEIKTDITKRTHDDKWVFWAKLSAVRVGLEDKEQVKVGNKRDYLTWIPIYITTSRIENIADKDSGWLDKLAQVYTVNAKQYKDATSI